MSLAGFFTWWFAELRGLFGGAPGRARKRGQVLSVAVGESEIVVNHLDNGRERELGRVSRGETSAARETLAVTVQGLRSRLELCEIRVSPRLALTRRISLPAAAEENLRQVLGFEMERQTPFRADNVYYDFDVVERDRKSRRIGLDLRVATRPVVDEALAVLGDLRLEQVPGEGEPTQPPGDTGASSDAPVALWFRPAGARRRGRSWVPVLLMLNVGLLVAVVTVPVVEQKRKLDVVRNELTEARQSAGRAVALTERIEAKKARARYVAATRQARPPMVRLMEELSERIPDGTSLTRLEVKSDTVNLQGLSDAASSLIAILESSAYLSGVRFSSPVVRQGNQGKDRFNLTATLSVPSADEETAARQATGVSGGGGPGATQPAAAIDGIVFRNSSGGGQG